MKKLSYPHPRQPTVRFLNPNASERSSIKIQRNSTGSWRQDEQSFIRSFPYRDSGSTNTARPGAADRTEERGDAKSGAISASQNYWVANASSSSADPHPAEFTVGIINL
jgi:hypothetical protein